MTEIADDQFRDVHRDGRTFSYVEGEIVIWCDKAPRGLINSVWIRNGQCAVWCRPGLDTFGETLERCRRLVHNGLVTCSTCGQEIKEGDVAGTHFAGYYCKMCYPKFQAANSRRCRLCGRPLWDCYC